MAGKKRFIVRVTKTFTIPFDEGLLDGKINLNHLMYKADAMMKTESHMPGQSFEVDGQMDDLLTPLSFRPEQKGVSLKEAEANKFVFEI